MRGCGFGGVVVGDAVVVAVAVVAIVIAVSALGLLRLLLWSLLLLLFPSLAAVLVVDVATRTVLIVLVLGCVPPLTVQTRF